MVALVVVVKFTSYPRNHQSKQPVSALKGSSSSLGQQLEAEKIQLGPYIPRDLHRLVNRYPDG